MRILIATYTTSINNNDIQSLTFSEADFEWVLDNACIEDETCPEKEVSEKLRALPPATSGKRYNRKRRTRTRASRDLSVQEQIQRAQNTQMLVEIFGTREPGNSPWKVTRPTAPPEPSATPASPAPPLPSVALPISPPATSNQEETSMDDGKKQSLLAQRELDHNINLREEEIQALCQDLADLLRGLVAPGFFAGKGKARFSLGQHLEEKGWTIPLIRTFEAMADVNLGQEKSYQYWGALTRRVMSGHEKSGIYGTELGRAVQARINELQDETFELKQELRELSRGRERGDVGRLAKATRRSLGLVSGRLKSRFNKQVMELAEACGFETRGRNILLPAAENLDRKRVLGGFPLYMATQTDGSLRNEFKAVAIAKEMDGAWYWRRNVDHTDHKIGSLMVNDQVLAWAVQAFGAGGACRGFESFPSTHCRALYQTHSRGVQALIVDLSSPDRSWMDNLPEGYIRCKTLLSLHLGNTDLGPEVDGMMIGGCDTLPSDHRYSSEQVRMIACQPKEQLDLLVELSSPETIPEHQERSECIAEAVEQAVEDGRLKRPAVLYGKGLLMPCLGLARNVLLIDLNMLKGCNKKEIKGKVRLPGGQGWIDAGPIVMGLLQDMTGGSTGLCSQNIMFTNPELPEDFPRRDRFPSGFGFELGIRRWGELILTALEHIGRGLYSATVKQVLELVMADEKREGKDTAWLDKVNMATWTDPTWRRIMEDKIRSFSRRHKYGCITEGSVRTGELSFPAAYLHDLNDLDGSLGLETDEEGCINFRFHDGSIRKMSLIIVSNKDWWEKMGDPKASTCILFRNPTGRWQNFDGAIAVNPHHLLVESEISNDPVRLSDCLGQGLYVHSEIIKVVMTGDTDGDIAVHPCLWNGEFQNEGTEWSLESYDHEDYAILWTVCTPWLDLYVDSKDPEIRAKSVNVEDYVKGAEDRASDWSLGTVEKDQAKTKGMVGSAALLQMLFTRLAYSWIQEREHVKFDNPFIETLFEKLIVPMVKSEGLGAVMELAINGQKKVVGHLMLGLLRDLFPLKLLSELDIFGIEIKEAIAGGEDRCFHTGWKNEDGEEVIDFSSEMCLNIASLVRDTLEKSEFTIRGRALSWASIFSPRLSDMLKTREDKSWDHTAGVTAWGIFEPSGIQDSVHKWNLLSNEWIRPTMERVNRWRYREEFQDNLAWSLSWDRTWAKEEGAGLVGCFEELIGEIGNEQKRTMWQGLITWFRASHLFRYLACPYPALNETHDFDRREVIPFVEAGIKRSIVATRDWDNPAAGFWVWWHYAGLTHAAGDPKAPEVVKHFMQRVIDDKWNCSLKNAVAFLEKSIRAQADTNEWAWTLVQLMEINPEGWEKFKGYLMMLAIGMPKVCKLYTDEERRKIRESGEDLPESAQEWFFGLPTGRQNAVLVALQEEENRARALKQPKGEEEAPRPLWGKQTKSLFASLSAWREGIRWHKDQISSTYVKLRSSREKLQDMTKGLRETVREAKTLWPLSFRIRLWQKARDWDFLYKLITQACLPGDYLENNLYREELDSDKKIVLDENGNPKKVKSIPHDTILSEFALTAIQEFGLGESDQFGLDRIEYRKVKSGKREASKHKHRRYAVSALMHTDYQKFRQQVALKPMPLFVDSSDVDENGSPKHPWTFSPCEGQTMDRAHAVKLVDPVTERPVAVLVDNPAIGRSLLAYDRVAVFVLGKAKKTKSDKALAIGMSQLCDTWREWICAQGLPMHEVHVAVRGYNIDGGLVAAKEQIEVEWVRAGHCAVPEARMEELYWEALEDDMGETWAWRQTFGNRRVKVEFLDGEIGWEEKVIEGLEPAPEPQDPTDNDELDWMAFGDEGDAVPMLGAPDMKLVDIPDDYGNEYFALPSEEVSAWHPGLDDEESVPVLGAPTLKLVALEEEGSGTEELARANIRRRLEAWIEAKGRMLGHLAREGGLSFDKAQGEANEEYQRLAQQLGHLSDLEREAFAQVHPTMGVDLNVWIALIQEEEA